MIIYIDDASVDRVTLMVFLGAFQKLFCSDFFFFIWRWRGNLLSEFTSSMKYRDDESKVIEHSSTGMENRGPSSCYARWPFFLISSCFQNELRVSHVFCVLWSQKHFEKALSTRGAAAVKDVTPCCKWYLFYCSSRPPESDRYFHHLFTKTYSKTFACVFALPGVNIVNFFFPFPPELLFDGLLYCFRAPCLNLTHRENISGPGPCFYFLFLRWDLCADFLKFFRISQCAYSKR